MVIFHSYVKSPEGTWYIQLLAFPPNRCPRKLWPSQGLAVVVALNMGSAAQIAGELSKQVMEMIFESDGPWAMDEIHVTGDH